MRFEIRSTQRAVPKAKLVYRSMDMAFAVEPQFAGFTSVVINDLNLEINQAGKVVQVWGYCPYPGWVKLKVLPPQADPSEVFVVNDEPFRSGVSLRVNPDRPWPILVDQTSGWVCLDSGEGVASAAEILSGVVLGLSDLKQLSAVYLKPEFLPPLQ